MFCGAALLIDRLPLRGVRVRARLQDGVPHPAAGRRRPGSLFGLMAAVLMKTDGIDWRRYDFMLRIGPLALLLATGALKLLDGETGQSFNVLSDAHRVGRLRALHPGRRARGAGRRAGSRAAFSASSAHTSYSIYLTHLAVLGLMHGLLLGARPDVATGRRLPSRSRRCRWSRWSAGRSRRLVEEPITRYGRSFKWSEAAPRSGVQAPDSRNGLAESVIPDQSAGSELSQMKCVRCACGRARPAG